MNKKSILLEIQYLAPIQYFCKLISYEKVVIEKEEHYIKGSFRNRCVIAMSDGKHSLSIPLEKGKNQQTDIREVRIDYSQNWQLMHFRTIKTAYGSAPYYDYYEPYILPFYKEKTEYLYDYCLFFQETICRLLKIKPNITFTDTYQKDYSDTETIDFRNHISPKFYNKAEAFDFEFNAFPYPQVFEDKNGFISNLSILDLLFCTGPEAIYYLHKSVKKA